MIGDRHVGVIQIDNMVFKMMIRIPELPEEFREHRIDRRRVDALSGEAKAFAECLMNMVAEDVKAIGPDFDMDKYEIEMTATLQPRGTNKFLPVRD